MRKTKELKAVKVRKSGRARTSRPKPKHTLVAKHRTLGVVVEARFYERNGTMGRTSVCDLVVRDDIQHTYGSGTAGGAGYHKESAALGDAVHDAGFDLYGDVYGETPTNRRAYINGVGERAMREALRAVAKAVTGKRAFAIVEV